MSESAWIALVTGPLGAFISYILTRKKNDAESTATIATGATQAVEAITAVLETLREELDATKAELDLVTQQLVELRRQNERLIEENKQLVKKIEELKQLVKNMGIDKSRP